MSLTIGIHTDADQLFSCVTSTDEPTVNENITLTCKASLFKYKYVAWIVKHYEDGTDGHQSHTEYVFHNETNHYSLTSTLHLNAISFADSGIYTCHAIRRDSEKTERKEVLVNVESMNFIKFIHFALIFFIFHQAVAAPLIVESNLNNKVIEQAASSRIELRCFVSGRPTPSIVWYRNGIELDINHDSGIMLRDRGQRLVFMRLLNKDSGTYECRVDNRGGHAMQRAHLRVMGPDSMEGIDISEILVIIVFLVVGFILLVMAVFAGKRIRRDRVSYFH